jgi:GT2 family glycosyltransferase
MRITALLTCHNRRANTLECLRRLAIQIPCGATVRKIVVDDGSNDGTSDAIAREFPEIRIIKGDGNLYWCGGMRTAWRAAAQEDPDYYLLLNDDTSLYPTALQKLVAIIPNPDCLAIAVAAICDPVTGALTYGGLRRKIGLIPVMGKTEPCDTFNANCALVPRAVYSRLGMLHDRYTHGMGDYDYGWLARRRGIQLIQSGEYLGECPINTNEGTWTDNTLPRLKRLQLLSSPKGHPFGEWLVFNYRNSGWKWPFYTISPIVRILLGR